MSPKALTSYDQIPYVSKPLPQTHPSRLAAVASMFGLTYAPPKTARVLELGCGSGVNLLGMAHFMPDAKFVGVDLSIVQIHEAQRRAEELGTKNVTYRHMSIDEIDPSFGEFDYIICHGVFSWVPPNVQQAIMRVSNENLAPEGIAYISYNVQPGWRLRQILRDTLLALTPSEMPVEKRWVYGTAWIKDALELSAEGDKQPLLHQALAQIMESVTKSKDGKVSEQRDLRYLVHEYLEVNNEPILFKEFLAKANEADLAYLGDAEPSSMVRHITNPALAKFFKGHPTHSMAESEQSIDILLGRTFRQSLVVKGNRTRQINRALSSNVFKNLHIQTHILKIMGENKEAQYHHFKVGHMQTQPPYGTAALEALSEYAHMSAQFGKLYEKFAELSNGTEEMFTEILFSLLGMGVIEIFADPYIPELPKGATPMALMDIGPGRDRTTNAIGEAIMLDPMQTLVLPLLVGDWDRSDVIAKLEALHAKGAFDINPQPADSDQLKGLLGAALDAAVARFKLLGVLG